MPVTDRDKSKMQSRPLVSIILPTWSRAVNLHRNLNQKRYIFALQIAPATAVKLLDSIAPSHINKGQFPDAKLGQFWVQINRQYDFLPTESGHLLDFNVTRCGMFKFLSDQGVPELTQVICRLDYHMAENFLLKCARLVRTQTIAENINFCDFRYLRQ